MMTTKSFCLACLLAIVTAIPSTAQSDVTKYYLKNYGFDTGFDYPATSTAKVTQEIKEIDGWTPVLSADYTITGVYEFGFKGTFNGAIVPATGYDGEAGGALALSTGWEQTFCYQQSVTLPAGTYTINVPTYNGKTATGGLSQLSWIPNSGTAVSSSRTSYKGKAWTLDQITFTLTKSTSGKIQIGYKAAAGGSANSACLLIDYVQILGQDMTVSKTKLHTTLSSANSLYGNGSGIGADELKAVIDAAQAVYDKAEATMPEVLEATYNLTETMEAYRLKNASEQNPLDRTSLIQNPSFETDGTTGWTVRNMSTQNNSVFSRKKGTYYLESWVSIGQKIGDASVMQTLKRLPQGRYRLKASALHIQQSGNNSTTNKGAAQTGVCLVAGTTKAEVTSMKEYTLSFAILDEKSDIEIGLKAENATGNYLCVDNFILQYLGEVTQNDYALELQKIVDIGQEILAKGIQQDVAATLTAAIDKATTALQGTGKDDEGNTTYDLEALQSAQTTLLDAISQGEASLALYTTLQKRIDYALKVVGWWEGVERKASTLATLQTAIETARQQMVDYTLTKAQLTTATNTLNTRIATVDKKIYCSTNACGTDAQLKNNTSQWSYERSLQSKHWILFWEAGYGTQIPPAVETILDNADKIFEFYADSLKFITTNQGKSKTDTYKMIIRLRYTDEWEASGSGIDDKIGLLTLSRWAYTSRDGQTVAHEIGHCFQYQTHCDNNDQNGWMYNWGTSTLNVFWEMCAQWQAYKFYPQMQFNNEWFTNTINGLHRHPLCVDLRYNNYFIQDYFCHKHGMDIIAQMWNKCKSPDDPLQTYMKLTMSGTTAEKLDQLNNEMWEYGARMTTFDLDPIRDRGKSSIGKRSQTALTSDSEGFFSPTAANCIENFGHNAIRLNVPYGGKTVYVELVGEAGKSGYTTYNKTKAGWKFGFVALQKDGTRIYGDIATATYNEPEQLLSFECPANCSYLWLVVSGAPTSYWTRNWLSWESESTAEQWPYKVKFYQTNVYGKSNNNELPSSINDIIAFNDDNQAPTNNNVYSLDGHLVRRGTTSIDGLPKGVYIVGGKKVMVVGDVRP